MRSPTTNAGIGVIICVIAVSGYFVWYSDIKAKSSAVAGLQSQIDAKSASATRTASARSALSQIVGDEAAVQSYFVSEAAVVAFINDLEARGLLQKAVVTVLSVSKDDTSTPPTLALSLSVKGTFDAVVRTVGTIEYAPYDTILSSLSLQQDDKKVWNVEMKLSVGSILLSSTATTTSSAVSPQATP